MLLPYQRKIFSDQSKFIICKIARQCGKSLTIAARSVYKSISVPKNLTVIISVNQRSADELLKKVKQWSEACKTVAPNLVGYTETASSVTYQNGSRILSLPANPESLRGFSGDIILDEFALVQDDVEIWRAVLPVVTSKMAGTEHTVTVASTPTSLDTQFAKIWNDTSGKWSKHSYTIYDCVKQGLKADPEELKTVVNDDLIWQTEYLAEFASTAGEAFPRECFEDCSFDQLPSGGCWYLGYDVARRGDFSAFVVLYEKDGIKYVVDIVKLKDTPYNQQLEFVKKLDQKYHFRAGYVDCVGVGSMISEEIERTVNSRIKPFTWTGSNKTELHDDLRTVLQDGKLKIAAPLVELVKADLSNVRRYISSTGRISYSAPHNSDGHSDVCSGLCLALRSCRKSPDCLLLPTATQRSTSFIGIPRI